VASELVQLSVVDPPEETLVGDAVRFTTGAAAAATVTVTVSDALPPSPVQESENWLSEVNALKVRHPETAFDPDQSPEAVQDTASVELQISVVDPL
jgi:hypothetical protein